MYVCMYLYVCIYLCLYVCLYVHLCMYVCMFVSIYPFIYLSISLSVCLSIYLSIYQYNNDLICSVQYRVTVKTGGCTFCGTNDDIFIRIVGKNGKTDKHELASSKDDFDKGE